MKVFVILTAMLWYEGVGAYAQTDFTREKFSSISECQDYVFKNKVDLVDKLLLAHRSMDDKVFGQVGLRSFEFFCETKYIMEEEEEELPPEKDKLILEL